MLEIRQETKKDYEEVYNIIKAPFEVPNENFMAIKLNNTDKEIIAVVEYAKEFGI